MIIRQRIINFTIKDLNFAVFRGFTKSFKSKMASASLSTSTTDEFTHIDGSLLEGGGQILRISTALSCILNKPISITKIRANRKDGGLKAQHLTGIEILTQISNGNLVGGFLKSKEIKLNPNKIKSGRYIGDTKTAGSICLLMQSCIPCLIFTEDTSILDLRGGTNAEHAPPIDYYESIFIPIIEKFGVKFTCEIVRRGYYPKGGGECRVTVNPVKELQSINITEFGTLKRFYGKSYVAGQLPIKIADAMAKAAQNFIKQKYKNIPIDIDIVKEPDNLAIGSGCGIIIIAETTTGCLLAGSGLGARGVPSEDVAKEAVSTLLEDLSSEACLDQYAQDQFIIFMALANGTSKIKTGPLTLHTQTAIYVTELLTGAKFTVTPLNPDDKNGAYYIECIGINYKNENL